MTNFINIMQTELKKHVVSLTKIYARFLTNVYTKFIPFVLL